MCDSFCAGESWGIKTWKFFGPGQVRNADKIQFGQFGMEMKKWRFRRGGAASGVVLEQLLLVLRSSSGMLHLTVMRVTWPCSMCLYLHNSCVLCAAVNAFLIPSLWCFFWHSGNKMLSNLKWASASSWSERVCWGLGWKNSLFWYAGGKQRVAMLHGERLALETTSFTFTLFPFLLPSHSLMFGTFYNVVVLSLYWNNMFKLSGTHGHPTFCRLRRADMRQRLVCVHVWHYLWKALCVLKSRHLACLLAPHNVFTHGC